MGKGLSPLQKLILQTAVHKKGRGLYSKMKGRFFIAEILVLYYNWKREGIYKSRYLFDRKKIGEKEYNSAKVAVFKSIKRLEERGLIKKHVKEEYIFSKEKDTWIDNKYFEGDYEITEEGRKAIGCPTIVVQPLIKWWGKSKKF